MSSASQQSKKIAWLESMLDTSIVAYESHRNALENIYAQLAQWQQPPGTGCIHISPDEVQELLRDINDVLDQCALQLQPFHSEPSNSNGAARVPPPSSHEPESKSRASSHRGVSATPSLRSPIQDHPLEPGQQQQQQQPGVQQRQPPSTEHAHPPAAQKTQKKTPSEYSPASRPRSGAAAVPAADPHEASARTMSDAPSSKTTNKSGTNPPPPPTQQQPKPGSHHRTAPATPSQASSAPPSSISQQKPPRMEAAPTPAESASDAHSVQSHPRVRESPSPAPTESTVRSSVPNEGSDAPRHRAVTAGNGGGGDDRSYRGLEARAGQEAARPRQPTDASSVRSATTQDSSRHPPQQQQQQQQRSNKPQEKQLQDPATAAAATAPAKPRPRMHACPHHQRVAGLALTPWPILNSGKDDAAAIGGPVTPTAAARAAATKDELPAEQYSAYKERGVPRATSAERHAAAEALERRAQAVEEAKKNATYLPPDDDVADRAAAEAAATTGRARQPAPTSTQSSQLNLNESQPSRKAPQQQQQQPRGASSSARVGPASTASSSVAAGIQASPPPQEHQQHKSERSVSAVEDEVDEIPRRRGSSAAAESGSDDGSSTYPSYVEDTHQNPSHRSSSHRSRGSQPQHPHQPQPTQQQQHRPAASHHSNAVSGSRTPSQMGSAFLSASANEGGAARHDLANSTPRPQSQQQQQQQQQHTQPSTVPSSRASSAVAPQSGSAHRQQQSQQQQQHPTLPSSASSQHGSLSGTAAASAPPPVKRQLNTGSGAQPPQMEASQVGSVGLVLTPSATPQRDSTRDFISAPQQAQQQQQSSSEAPVRSSARGAHRPLRTAVPRRTTPRAYDSTQSEEAIFHGRLRNSPSRPAVRSDSPHALRYMEREDSQLRQRKEEELAEVQTDPRALQQQQQQQQIGGPNGPLGITDGAGGGGALVARKGGQPQQLRMTALEEQLIAERTALHNQLEKMQMEVTIATGRNKEWGNERRYAQVNTRMKRVLEDLDRVEKELRTVRNLDREAQ